MGPIDASGPSPDDAESSTEDAPAAANQIASLARERFPSDERELLADALWDAAVECGDEDVEAVAVATLDGWAGALVITEANVVFASVGGPKPRVVPKCEIAQAYEITPNQRRLRNRPAESAGLRLRLESGAFVTYESVGSAEWATELAARATASSPAQSVVGPRISDDGTTRCPWCAEPVQPEAVVCRWCSRGLTEQPLTRPASRSTPDRAGGSPVGYLGFLAHPVRLAMSIALVIVVIVGYIHVTAPDFKEKCAVHRLATTFRGPDPVKFPDTLLCDLFG